MKRPPTALPVRPGRVGHARWKQTLPIAVTSEPGLWQRRLTSAATVAFVAVIVVGAILLLASMVQWLLTAELFAIQRIDCAGGTAAHDAEIYEELRDLEENRANIWLTSLQRVRGRVQKLTWATNISVERVYPNALRVTYQRRRAVARAAAAEGTMLAVDENGVCFYPPVADQASGVAALPLLVDAGAQPLRAGERIAGETAAMCAAVAGWLQELAPCVWSETAYLSMGRYREVRLCTHGPLGEVVLASFERGAPVFALDAVRQTVAQQGINCESVDFRLSHSSGVVRVLPPAAVVSASKGPAAAATAKPAAGAAKAKSGGEKKAKRGQPTPPTRQENTRRQNKRA